MLRQPGEALTTVISAVMLGAIAVIALFYTDDIDLDKPGFLVNGRRRPPAEREYHRKRQQGDAGYRQRNPPGQPLFALVAETGEPNHCRAVDTLNTVDSSRILPAAMPHGHPRSRNLRRSVNLALPETRVDCCAPDCP